MIHYYINPKTRSLIMLDPDAGEIFVVERIEKVRVMTSSEIRLGDFDGPNPKDTTDKFDAGGGYRNPYLHEGGNYPKKGRPAKASPSAKQYLCKTCGVPGHRRKTCPTATATAAPTQIPPSSEN